MRMFTAGWSEYESSHGAGGELPDASLSGEKGAGAFDRGGFTFVKSLLRSG